MERYKNLLNSKKMHFIGVGGVSISALSRHFILKNREVSGTDVSENPDYLKVRELGGKVKIGNFPSAVKEADAVIYSSAISEDNPDLKLAKSLNIPTYRRSELLGAVMSEYKNSIAVSGSHGKTTTTAMITDVLSVANLSPTSFCGGNTYRFGNYLSGAGDYIVAEACEYKKSFLDIKPKISVILNVDDDHLDCYGSMKELISSFNEFASGSIAVVNADDQNARYIDCPLKITYGINGIASYKAERLKEYADGYAFTVRGYGIKLGRIRLKVSGLHNVYNALAVVTVCDQLKIPFTKIKKGLEEFVGVERRNESVGKIGDCEFVCDYAHHPSEILATTEEYLRKGKKFFTIFQPHTYSRTRILMNDFLKVLSRLENLIIYKTYSAREEFDALGDAKTLYNKLKANGKKDVVYLDNENDLEQKITKLSKKHDICLTLGAGDIYFIVKGFLK